MGLERKLLSMLGKTMTATSDKILYIVLCPEYHSFCRVWGDLLVAPRNTNNWRKKGNPLENDGTPKIQISVPCGVERVLTNQHS